MQAKKEYSQELRRRVAQCYHTSDLSLVKVGRKFGVSSGSVHQWSQEFQSEFAQEAQLRQEITTFGAVTNTHKPMKEKNLTPEQMVARIAELEQKLEHEKMHRIVLDTMIDIAERDLNIAIRKKYGAKQSK